MFQFPSNGKDFQNGINGFTALYTYRVSIPFKREGLSELNLLEMRGIPCPSFNSLQTGRSFRTKIIIVSEVYIMADENKFQFPSNGKDFPNQGSGDTFKWFGIRFQFPSNGKDFPNSQSANLLTETPLSFNSLQTGRTFRTHVLPAQAMQITYYNEFQFPSNGKDFPNKHNTCPQWHDF